MSVEKLIKEDFETAVMGADKTIVIDFWADWCSPCKMMAPIFAEIAEERSEEIFYKVNIDEQPELTATFNVNAVPTFIAIKDRKITAREVGMRTKEELLSMIQK